MTDIARALPKLTSFTLALCVALLTGCSEDAPEPIDLVINNVTVVDAVNPVRSNQTVLIDQGRIIDIVSGDSAIEVTAREQIDASGRYLMPGLWDFHVHFTFDKRFTDAMAGLFLYYGVTQVRDTGALLEDLLPAVETLRSAGARAPGIWYAGPLLDGKDVVYDGVNFPGLGIANPTPEAARANIAEIHAAGASFLKIYEMVSPEVFAAIVDEARRSPCVPEMSHPMCSRWSTCATTRWIVSATLRLGWPPASKSWRTELMSRVTCCVPGCTPYSDSLPSRVKIPRCALRRPRPSRPPSPYRPCA